MNRSRSDNETTAGVCVQSHVQNTREAGERGEGVFDADFQRNAAERVRTEQINSRRG